MQKRLGVHLTLLFLITIVLGSIYVVTQQNYREGANDPQIQMAEDAAQALDRGRDPQSFIPKETVDLKNSLAPFLIIFDRLGKPIVSSGLLDGKIPVPPPGVFDYTRKYKEDRVTWQPKTNLRIAAVLERFEGSNPGYVLVGRSLKEVEK